MVKTTVSPSSGVASALVRTLVVTRSATSAAMVLVLSAVLSSSWSPSTVAVLLTLVTLPLSTVAFRYSVAVPLTARLPMVQTSSPAPTT